ncbi:hypothetical protein MKW98_019981 [Papaver atlanticum]|uniref:Protein kinase domain-containing protein n=1 Tax=Papaver atlanticum TaxID=357466 RepID=A0AAD4S1J6_9MAGN|nr:hypothetical protein MKW98_019981 [Papaver atlanticum]
MKSVLFGCFKSQLPLKTPKEKIRDSTKNSGGSGFQRLSLSEFSSTPGSSLSLSANDISNSLLGSNLHIFTLQELQKITNSFSSSNFLGEGGFGAVHKGFIDDKMKPGLKAQPIAVKLLDLDGLQGHREWLSIRLIIDNFGIQFVANQIFITIAEYGAALPWGARMKIALGAAKSLAFLHDSEKPVIYRNFKTSNILLDVDYTAKLSDFGLAKDGPEGDETHVSTRVMGTHGYAAPEYVMTGHLTTMSDVYSFCVVLLEILTGRRAVDKSRGPREHNLVEWARPQLNNPRKLDYIIDPRLDGQYSSKGAQKIAALAYQCLSHHPKPRPSMSNVVKILESLQNFNDMPIAPFVYIVLDETVKKDLEKIEPEQKKEIKDENRQTQRQNGQRHRIRTPRARTGTVYTESNLRTHLKSRLSPDQKENQNKENQVKDESI